MEVKHRENSSKGLFYIEHEGDIAARMTYSRAGDKFIIIDHTEVEEELRGKSAGKQMVMAAVEYARDNDLSIIPLCPFAKKVFDKIESIRDVLKK